MIEKQRRHENPYDELSHMTLIVFKCKLMAYCFVSINNELCGLGAGDEK